MDQGGPVITWRRRLLFDEDELSRVEDHARVLEQAKADAERALTAARLHFETLSSQVAEVHGRRDLLRTSTTHLRAQLAALAFQRLPLEVLRLVFLELAQDDDQRSINYSIGPHILVRTKTPFVLAAVSRRWRDLALTTSLLWTYIAVPTTNNARAVDYVEILLCRSGKCPVDVFLPWNMSATPKWTNTTTEGRILDLISAHTKRWRRFRLHIPKGAINLGKMVAFRCPTPMLEGSYIVCQEEAPGPASTTYLPFAPRIRSIYARNCQVVPSPQSVPLTHLHTLYLFASISCHTMWAILRLAPNVEFLSVETLSPPPDPDYRLASRLTLPRLLSLYALGDVCATFAANAQELALPSVNTIHTDTAYVLALSPLWQKLGRTVTSLRLHDDRINSAHIDALCPLARVYWVAFKNCVLTSDFLDALAEERAGSWVFPALEIVDLLPGSRLEPDNGDSFTRLIRARNGAHLRGLPGAPQKISGVAFDTQAVSRWIAEQVTFVLEESA
ncbi:hypothetical protein AURDEDRAFT_176352 [Auricularia subglabra TFB-10046 SS5]|uniref:F-box domain-containing protein n=1 Tax=Auricularia subglabra (strain TFB-10046 / SS5) TaxID=717982 RepID=J0WRL7_AURST|nr:hypothetical protein AURDEDRAFT_176352 [Auricularia subglabra TFB-10046 SS5]